MHLPFGIDRQVGYGKPLGLKVLASIEDRMVLNLRGDDVPTLPLLGKGDPLNGEVVGFSPARGKDDFARRGTEYLGHFISGLIDCLA